MDYLFSPWRYRYLTAPRPVSGCVLCAKLAPLPAGEGAEGGQAARDAENLLLHRAQYNAVMLNLYPYTSGHLMILPYAHVASLGECGAAARGEMMELAARAEAALKAEYRPDGMNLGMNLGEAAGAGIADHLHLHVLPRWVADANFVTVVGETRVLPEELAATFRRLRPHFAPA
ncbi:MAG: HIT family protein [Chloroflexota bacterium]